MNDPEKRKHRVTINFTKKEREAIKKAVRQDPFLTKESDLCRGAVIKELRKRGIYSCNENTSIN